MDIIPNGTTIEVIDNEIKGLVIEASIIGIKNHHIMYKIAWWSGGNRNEAWVGDYEVKPYIDNTKKAGLVNYDTDIIKKP